MFYITSSPALLLLFAILVVASLKSKYGCYAFLALVMVVNIVTICSGDSDTSSPTVVENEPSSLSFDDDCCYTAFNK